MSFSFFSTFCSCLLYLYVLFWFIFLTKVNYGVVVGRGGFSGEEERLCPSNFQPKKLENWENQILNPSLRVPVVEVIKQEVTQQYSNLYGHHHANEEFQAPRLPVPPAAWSQIMGTAVSSPSPRSCITTSSSNMLDFTYNKATDGSISNTQPPVDRSSEVNKDFTYIYIYMIILKNVLIKSCIYLG